MRSESRDLVLYFWKLWNCHSRNCTS